MIHTILLSIAIIIATVLFIAKMMKKEYVISSEIIINMPNDKVFKFVKHLRNQERYSKWVMADPNIQLDYKGNDGTVGFVAAWTSNNKDVGVGNQKITNILENYRYDVIIHFEKPFKGVSTAFTTTQAISENQTNVCTTFNTSTPFPMNIMIPMIKKMLKKDMDLNMQTLKRVLEEEK
jgi:hypothetical protein